MASCWVAPKAAARRIGSISIFTAIKSSLIWRRTKLAINIPILPFAEWQALAEKLKAAGIAFIIEPNIRFKGETGEQATMFFLDPSGNALEFKSFADLSQVFAK